MNDKTGTHHGDAQANARTAKHDEQAARHAGTDFDTGAWTPADGYTHNGLLHAYHHDQAFAARVAEAYTAEFNSLSGIEQYKFYDANRQIGNMLYDKLGINGEWINRGDATIYGGQPFTGVLTPR